MEDLNSHYCLATKEHYDKLVEDGYNFFTNGRLDETTKKLYFISDKEFYKCHIKYTDDSNTPMHLHNNEWVFGSLEHEETFHRTADRCPKGCKSVLKHYGTTMTYKCCTCGHTWEDGFVVKKVERISRESALAMYDTDDVPIINKIFDYVEYLEANQKENS